MVMIIPGHFVYLSSGVPQTEVKEEELWRLVLHCTNNLRCSCMTTSIIPVSSFLFYCGISIFVLTGSPRMSRRRVSVKDLKPVDHQGWLYRKKEGKGFLGIKWKKYWFVLKKTTLYWYPNQVVSHLSAEFHNCFLQY